MKRVTAKPMAMMTTRMTMTMTTTTTETISTIIPYIFNIIMIIFTALGAK